MNPLLNRSAGDLVRVSSHQSVHNPTPPTVPQHGTPQGGRDRYVRSEQLIINSTAAFAYTDLVARFQIDNPSTRLHVKAAVGFRPVNREETAFPTGGAGAWLWRLDAWDRTEDGLLIPTNNIFTNRPLPSSYEAITSTDQWRGAVTVPAGDAGIAIDGVAYVVATWEPAPGWNGDPEKLAKLFQACKLRVTNGITVSSGGV